MNNRHSFSLVGKPGKEIFSANSFMGFVGGLTVISIGSWVFIAIIEAIICGIASLFK